MDNPTVGEYTKGISANCVGYFKNMERRARLEKTSLRGVAIDLKNPLFAILNAPLDPLQMLKGQDRIVPEKVAPVDKSVEKAQIVTRKITLKVTSFSELRALFSTEKPRRQRKK